MVGVGGQGGDEVAVRGKNQWKEIFSRGFGGDSAELSASVESWSNGSGPKYRKQKMSQKTRRGERPNQPFSHSTLNAGQL